MQSRVRVTNALSAASTMAGCLLVCFALLIAFGKRHYEHAGRDFPPMPALMGGDQASSAARSKIETLEVTVARGDHLGGLLREIGVEPTDVVAALSALSSKFDGEKLRAGQVLHATLHWPDAESGNAQLRKLEFNPEVERHLSVNRATNGAFELAETIKTLTPTTQRASGRISESLYDSAKAQGIPDAVIVSLIRIYSHAVDFQREVRDGDQFDLLYTTFVDSTGESLKSGEIEYAQLTLSGQHKPLFRYTSFDGSETDYYSPDGVSGKRLLMRTPIDGARLTSGYGLREHPILGYTKLHRGVDFAARTGTPIMAAGHGVVEKANWAGGYGRYVKIKHAQGYKTAYAHMSRFAPGIAPGQRVRQGQIIGYVGTTGRSTGPHLHYEVMDGEQIIDPQDRRLPTGTKLADGELDAFKAHVITVTARMNSLAQKSDVVAQGLAAKPKLLP